MSIIYCDNLKLLYLIRLRFFQGASLQFGNDEARTVTEAAVASRTAALLSNVQSDLHTREQNTEQHVFLLINPQ